MISGCTVNNALANTKRPEGIRDCRGIGGGNNTMDAARVHAIIEHITKFPEYKSHYRRANTETGLLTDDTYVATMYRLYCAAVRTPVSLSSYRKVLLSTFNLRRKRLTKDTCTMCDRFEIEIQHCANNVELQTLKGETWKQRKRHTMWGGQACLWPTVLLISEPCVLIYRGRCLCLRFLPTSCIPKGTCACIL